MLTAGWVWRRWLAAREKLPKRATCLERAQVAELHLHGSAKFL
jgi:hypothetical protein